MKVNRNRHTPECAALAAEQQAGHAAWLARWPNHCKTCHGKGGHISWADEDSHDFEPCEDCALIGRCSRCGQPGLTSEDHGDDSTGEGPCKLCGWDYDDQEPEIFGCVCPREGDADAF
jgi:hypothetical protein